MNRRARLSWIAFILLIPIAAFSQGATSSSRPNSKSAKATATPDPKETDVIYTGRLFGYFRVPTLQTTTVNAALPPCPATSANDSPAAQEFKKFREQHANSVLIGTGDNFAPQLEARVFSYLDEKAPTHVKYHPANKELYVFDKPNNKWVHVDEIDDKLHATLKNTLTSGKGTIPTDNVACFLAAAGYAAVVPGRHDFYFGAERVRQLARLMAGLNPESRSPQMLGANLVLKTTLVDPGDPVSDKGKPIWMETKWPKEYSLTNLPKTVYPWFQAFKIKVSGDDETQFSDYDKQFHKDSFFVCKSKGKPNEIEEPPANSCHPLKPESSGNPGPTSATYRLPIVERDYTGGKGGHFSTLTPSTNYALCLVRDPEANSVQSKKLIICQRFSVHQPFFYFPRYLPQAPTNDYTDPDPFVFIAKEEGKQPNEVAIFGVVDPQLGEQVGVLNFAWKNDDDKYKSIVSVEDPAQALREQVEYFEKWYDEKHPGTKFQGLKILLAQMNPQRAHVLAARFPGFQIVVAGADREQATTEVSQTFEWSKQNPVSAFVAVPDPYFNTQAQAGILNPGLIKATPENDKWTLKTDITCKDPLNPTCKIQVKDKIADGSINHTLEITTKKGFADDVDNKLKQCLPTHLPDEFKPAKTLTDKLKLVTLCAMREHVNADMAIVQKRDFFPASLDTTDPTPLHVQQFLDRFIWKGDLLTLMFVPGKAIKEALKHSSRVDGEEKAVLTLDSEKGRGFEQVGARYDADRDRYLINELPIDDAKTYTVVTSDYVGAGDTGYPELVASALNPRKQPDAFPQELETISSIACRYLYADAKDKKCLANINRDKYLDTITANPTPPYEQRAAVKKFFRLSPFGAPDKTSAPETPAQAQQQLVERRPIWTFSLRRISLGFNTLKNNMTDAQIDERFGGISTSGVTAHRNRGVNVKLDTRSAISWHRSELFLESGIDYQDISKGRANDDMEFDQITNRFTVDPGWLWRYPGRGKPHFATVFSIHLETPFRRPVDTFFLSSRTVVDPVNNISIRDRLEISQERGFLVLPRAGLRWQNRDTTYFEVGFQRGKEYDAFTGYQFVTGNVTTTCVPDAKKTIVSCIEDKSKPPNPTITKDSVATAILMNRPRSGFYWKGSYTLPFGRKVKYEFSDEGDFFAKNFDSDLVTDTRFRDYSKHSLKFFVWPNLSFGPALNLLLYQNKINKNWLTQKQFTLEATMSFDFYNWREKSVQFRNKP
jgi:5'-nucleotidase, C-terminal domain